MIHGRKCQTHERKHVLSSAKTCPKIIQEKESFRSPWRIEENIKTFSCALVNFMCASIISTFLDLNFLCASEPSWNESRLFVSKCRLFWSSLDLCLINKTCSFSICVKPEAITSVNTQCNEKTRILIAKERHKSNVTIRDRTANNTAVAAITKVDDSLIIWVAIYDIKRSSWCRMMHTWRTFAKAGPREGGTVPHKGWACGFAIIGFNKLASHGL